MAVKYKRLGRALLAVAVMLVFSLSACDKLSAQPPPESANTVMLSVKDGYNNEDMDKFCGDFSDIMFTQGFTRQAYLDVVQGLKKKFGTWQSERYLGMKDGAYLWRLQFAEGRAKLVLVQNNTGRVTGLWFR